jgi:hypothetical protein
MDTDSPAKNNKGGALQLLGKIMKQQQIIACTLVLLLAAAHAFAAQDAAVLSPAEGLEILKKSDARLIPGMCSYDLTLITREKQGTVKTNRFKGYKKDLGRNVMVVQEPKRIAGSVHLRKDNVIWSYFTTNKRLTKMAYQAIFMGTLLNYGDIMATELSADYDVTRAAITGDSYELTLKPRQGHEGYGSIILTIDRKTLFPRKRQHFSLSGLLVKECEHTVIEHDGAKTIHVEMVFYEPMKERKTEVKFCNIQLLNDIPETYYNENLIKFLSGE